MNGSSPRPSLPVPPGRPRRRPATVLSLLLLVAAALLLGSSSSAGAATGARSHEGAKPTIVLVHGAWADASSWSGVITRLQRDGYPVVAPANPLRLLSTDSAYVRSVVDAIPGPVVLVGHSYGGAVITNAATGDTDVRALVYVDAFAPDQGEVVNQLVGATSAFATNDPSTLFDVRPYAGAPAGDADLYLKPTTVRQYFAQDLPKREADLIAATQRPLTLAAGNEPSGVPAWRTIPSWYLVGTQDRIITPDAQRSMAARAGAHVVEVKASHVSLVSRPGAVADLVERAAAATR